MKIKDTKDQVFIEMCNPAMEAIGFPADPSYLEAFQSVAKQITESQVGLSTGKPDIPGAEIGVELDGEKLTLTFTGVPEGAKFILRSGNHSIVHLSPLAATRAIEILTFNWMSFKFARGGNHVLGQKASDEYYRRMANLNSGRSGFSKEEVALIHRYLD